MTDPSRTPDEERRAFEQVRRQQDAERDEARRRERVRREMDREVSGDAALADRAAPASVNPLDRITAERRTPVVDARLTAAEIQAGRGVTLAARIVNFLFLAIYILLGLRLLLGVLGANPEAGFVRWIAAASGPLYAPFRGVFPTVTIEDGFTFVLSVAFALLVYALLHALVNALLRVFGAPRGVL
ncbi:MAG TPA: hypothetical protein VLE53_12195 [Gemmatimonadaceae bacterium]|nr:hypothetical protein [Gemmatimonadaceae bacterium]